MIVMIDNYDSFTYNLVQEMGKVGAEMHVYRNDVITVDELAAQSPTALIVSPGPGSPAEAGISIEAIQRFSGKIPILGVCLGHQSIIAAFGGRIIHAKSIMHGKTSPIRHDNDGIFKGLPIPFEVGRYHSLVGERETIPDCLVITAETQDEDNEIMGIRHRQHLTFGVQFHPESVLTGEGMAVLENFLRLL